MIGRRGFITALAAAMASGAAFDIERFLWVPGKKLISLPHAPKIAVRWLQGYDIYAGRLVSHLDTLSFLPAADCDIAFGAVVRMKNNSQLTNVPYASVTVEHGPEDAALSRDDARRALAHLARTLKVNPGQFILPPVPPRILEGNGGPLQ